MIGYTGHGDYGHGLDGIFANRAGIEIVAVVDRDAAGRRRTAEKIGAARQYADYREMLEKEHPQLVSLAMRQAAFHYEIALAVLRHGAHLYCEKPFTTTPAEADALLAEANRRRLKIAVAHTMRMMPIVRSLKGAIAEGLLGDVVQLRAHGKQDTRSGGEDMMVLGTHLFDLMRLFAGSPEWCTASILSRGKDITAQDGRRVTDDVGLVAGDEVFAQFGFPRGVKGSFVSAGRLRESLGPWGIELLGSKRVARINCDISPNVFIRETTAWDQRGTRETWKPLDASLLQALPQHNAGPVGDWLEAIEQDREPECSGRNGAWAVEMAMAAYQAALSGRRIRFPLAVRTHPLKQNRP